MAFARFNAIPHYAYLKLKISEELIFDIAPFRSGYHALLGRTPFAHFNAVPHYAYLKLKMPGQRGVITVSGNTERSLRAEEYVAPLAAAL